MTAYATETAQDFSAFYRDCRVVGAAEEGGDEDVRLAICVMAKRVLAQALDLVGSRPPRRCEPSLASSRPMRLAAVALLCALACSPALAAPALAVDRYVPMKAPPARVPPSTTRSSCSSSGRVATSACWCSCPARTAVQAA